MFKNNISKNIVYLFFSIFFIIGVFTFKDYGLTGDEVFERQTGFYWLNYVLGFTPFDNIKSIAAIKFEEIKGFTLPKTEDNPFYGVIFSLPAAFLEVIFNIEDSKNYYHLYHFLNFTLFFIASIFFYKLLLNRFLNINIALVGTLFFVLSPRIYASSFYNNKDLVFLSLATIALYYCFKSLEKINYKNLLIFSIFAAMCTSSRIFGVIFPVFFSITFTNFQDLLFEIGRHSWIVTKSPAVDSLFSSWACIFEDLLSIFLYIGCFTFLSISTVIVLSLEELKTLPDSCLIILSFIFSSFLL